MWERSVKDPKRTSLIRRLFIFCQVIIVTSFAFVLINSNNAFALAASWSSTSTIEYNGYKYNGPVAGEDLPKLELSKDNQAYISVDEASKNPRKIKIIYFNNESDENSAKNANYKELTYLGPNNYSSPTSPILIDIDTKSESNISNNGSSCEVKNGMGWILCPLTNTLADGMDWVFDVIKDFMTVRPVIMDQEGALYRTWAMMRSIANIAFVAAFLMIVYAQITGYGFSSYNIKKMVPRLVVAAILVNLSYYICALAVDLSNTIGYSVQDVLMDIRNSVNSTQGNNWDIYNWKSVSTFILSGGTAAVAGITSFTLLASTYGAIGSIYLLLPILVTGLMAVLATLAILAARQALVTVMIILAPLAFVSYLLPNTDKWFGKWKSTFTNMLVLFPLMSLLFGGAQLAASIIIENADSINTIILGMAVQVVPLFMMPFLIKVSGSILGKVAGFVNNPNKGPIDATRKFAQDRANYHGAKFRASDAKKHEVFKRFGQWRDMDQRKREGWTKAYGAKSDARWANSSQFSDIDQANREYSERKSLGETRSEARYTSSRITNGSLEQLDVHIRKAKLDIDENKIKSDINWENNNNSSITESKFRARKLNEDLSLAKLINDNQYEEFKTKKYIDSARNTTSPELLKLMEEARSTSEALSIQAIRKQSIAKVKNVELADSLVLSEAKRQIAGASSIDVNGADSAFASALATIQDSYSKTVKERTALMSHFNLAAADYQKIAMRGEEMFDANGKKMYDKDGRPMYKPISEIQATTKTSDGTKVSYKFNVKDEYNTEAAIDRQIKIGLYKEKREIIESSGKDGHLSDFAASIAAAMAAYGVGDKAPQFGGGSINVAAQGGFIGHNVTLKQAANFIGDGKFKAEDIANADTVALTDMIDAFKKARNGELYDESNAEEFERLQKLNNYSSKFLKVAYDILDESNNIGNNASAGTKQELEKLLIESGISRPPKKED